MGNKALDLSDFIATHKDADYDGRSPSEKRIDLYKSRVFYDWCCDDTLSSVDETWSKSKNPFLMNDHFFSSE